MRSDSINFSVLRDDLQCIVHSASIEPDNAISRWDGYPEGYSGTVLRVATLNQLFGFLRLFRELNDKK